MSQNIKIHNLDIHKNIENPLIDLIHYNFPSSNLNHIELDFKYHDYYIAYNQQNGLVMTDCFTKFEHISNDDIKKILCMKIHHSVLEHYNLYDEYGVAKLFNNLFNL